MTPEAKRYDDTLVNARATYHNALKRVYVAASDHHGKMYRPRLDIYEREHVAVPLSIPMSFSCTLLDLVGGLQMLDYFWEADAANTPWESK